MSRQLHPALGHLLLAGFAFICFGILRWQVAERRPITTFDQQHAERLYEYTVAHPRLWDVTMVVTDLGSGRPRTVVIIAVTLLLLWSRNWRLALLWAASQWYLKDLVAVLKDYFERPRPDFPTTPNLAGGWAYPSGHACGAMVTYGMLCYLVAWHDSFKRIRWPLIALFGLFIIAVGLSRLLLGVHWFTDVLGGFFLGMASVSLVVAIVEAGWGKPCTESSIDESQRTI